MSKLLEIMNAIIVKKGRDPLKKLEADMMLRENLGLDSLDLAELTVRIEDEFDVDIFEDSFVRTVGEILEKIQ